jgi:hypothetical protein
MSKHSHSDWSGSILTLHRYFCWASKLQGLVKEAIGVHEETARAERERSGIDLSKASSEAIEWLEISQLVSSDFGLYMFHYYGALYVVVEGFRELELQDNTVETLLTSPNTDALRRTRNGTFHFQRDYFSPKLLDRDLDQDQFIDWVEKLHDAFRTCLQRELHKAGLL